MVKHWYNGALSESDQIQLSISDPGLIYGATTFTTLRVYQSLDHELTNWTAHIERLRRTIEAFHWQAPNWENIRLGAEWLSKEYSVLRIVVFPDGREWITGRFLPSDLVERQQGITAWVADAELCRSLPQHKTGNYLAPWLALQFAQRCNAQEAILTDFNRNWLETSTGTLWGWKDNAWWTPPLEKGILPGLLRSRLISGLDRVIEETWSLEIVQAFEAIAYTNCVMEVVPIHTVLDRDQYYRYDAQHPKIWNLTHELQNLTCES